MTALATDCYCSAGPGPHKHAPAPAAHPLDMAHVPIPVSGVIGSFPWPPEAAPQPEPPRPATRANPLYGVQFLRKEAVRLAIDSYRDTDRPSDDELLATANRLAAFIRSGDVPTPEQED